MLHMLPHFILTLPLRKDIIIPIFQMRRLSFAEVEAQVTQLIISRIWTHTFLYTYLETLIINITIRTISYRNSSIEVLTQEAQEASGGSAHLVLKRPKRQGPSRRYRKVPDYTTLSTHWFSLRLVSCPMFSPTCLHLASNSASAMTCHAATGRRTRRPRRVQSHPEKSVQGAEHGAQLTDGDGGAWQPFPVENTGTADM